jgi:hypothetical protein
LKALFKSGVVVRLAFSYESLSEDGETHIDELMREVRQVMGEIKRRMEAFGVIFAAETDHMVTYEIAEKTPCHVDAAGRV